MKCNFIEINAFLISPSEMDAIGFNVTCFNWRLSLNSSNMRTLRGECQPCIILHIHHCYRQKIYPSMVLTSVNWEFMNKMTRHDKMSPNWYEFNQMQLSIKISTESRDLNKSTMHKMSNTNFIQSISWIHVDYSFFEIFFITKCTEFFFNFTIQFCKLLQNFGPKRPKFFR